MPDLSSVAARLRPVTALSTDGQSGWQRPTRSQLKNIAGISKSQVDQSVAFSDVTVRARGEEPAYDESHNLLCDIAERKGMLEAEQGRLRALFKRLDNMYYPEEITEQGGADHWPDGRKAGRVHISMNDNHIYVDIPASLQAVPPVENYLAPDSSPEERDRAARSERLYFQWKEDTGLELLIHEACVVKALYGFTFGKVYWDPIDKLPKVRFIDAPENLYVGWGDSDYRRMDWTIYCYGLSPQAAREEYGVNVEAVETAEGKYVPYVYTGSHADPLGQMRPYDSTPGGRLRSAYEEMQVEVYDYWYKKPKGRGKKPEIWNAIFVGNQLVENAKHSELDRLPYVPLPNTYIPKSPYGRSELYDLEQMFREYDERLSEGGQMIHTVIEGQMWQVVGSEAPDSLEDNMVPRPGKVATPGPNAEIKAIQPNIPQFQLSDYLDIIDTGKQRISGLNDLLVGLAPATILGSSKAITALVANYEARIRIKRQLLYQARKEIWAIAAEMWERKSSEVREILDGQHRLSIIEPELTPRDQLENAQKAINLVQNRLWSMRRAMDATGVEDPEEELTLVREEQTDPALNPASVLQQVSLAAGMQQLGGSLPGQAPPGGAPTAAQGANAARTLNRPAAGTEQLNAPEEQGNPAPDAQPANAGGPGGPGGGAIAQTMVNEDGASGRILTQTPLG